MHLKKKNIYSFSLFSIVLFVFILENPCHLYWDFVWYRRARAWLFAATLFPYGWCCSARRGSQGVRPLQLAFQEGAFCCPSELQPAWSCHGFTGWLRARAGPGPRDRPRPSSDPAHPSLLQRGTSTNSNKSQGRGPLLCGNHSLCKTDTYTCVCIYIYTATLWSSVITAGLGVNRGFFSLIFFNSLVW